MIIIDPKICSPLYENNNFLITPPKGVKLVAQIRSIINDNNVQKDKIKLESVKNINAAIPRIFIGIERQRSIVRLLSLRDAIINEIFYFSSYVNGNTYKLEKGQLKAYFRFVKDCLNC